MRRAKATALATDVMGLGFAFGAIYSMPWVSPWRALGVGFFLYATVRAAVMSGLAMRDLGGQ